MCSYSIVENSKPTKGSGRHLLSASLMPGIHILHTLFHVILTKTLSPTFIELNLIVLELGFRLPNPRCSDDLVPTSYYKGQVGEKPLLHSFHMSGY